MKSSPINGVSPDNAGFAKKEAAKEKTKAPLLPHLNKILRRSDGALLSCEREPKEVMHQVSQLREGLDGFPSRWAGKRRVVGRIHTKRKK